MRLLGFLTALFLFANSCNLNEKSKNAENKIEKDSSGKSAQFVIKVDNFTATVGIDSFILITNSLTRQRADAVAIMTVKRNWPLAMQRKDRNLFESILASQFTFRAEDEFYNRKDYIKNRVNGPAIVDTAKYENLVLQFFGETALLTYRNIITGKDSLGKNEAWQYSWADIYLKEEGSWKIGGSHLIQERKLY